MLEYVQTISNDKNIKKKTKQTRRVITE